MILAVIESFLLNFVLLIVCVINIRNGAVGGVHYYEQPVKDRVVALGLITEKEIKRNYTVSGLVFMLVLLIAAPIMVFCVNGAETFLTDLSSSLLCTYYVGCLAEFQESC